MYLNRTLSSSLEKLNKTFSVVLLTGPKQIGKTTLLKHASKGKREYISFDNLTLRNQAKEDPELFLQKYQTPLLIDEIQYAPELLPYIKIIVDREKKPGMFWLTGSQKFNLMKGISESLAGRVGILQMLGLSLKEMSTRAKKSLPFLPNKNLFNHKKVDSLTLNKIYEIIWRGSFPLLYENKKTDWEVFYSSYVNTYIERDIRDLTQVANERSFFKFLRIAAARTAQLINYTDMARDADISVNTAKNWLSLLETSGIIYILEPYYMNRTTRIVKTPKIYFLDTGLCAYLTNWKSPATLEAGAMSGPIFETFVISEIIKSYWHNGKQAPIYFYRDSNKNEIDLLIEQDGKIHPIEIKKTSNPNKNDIKTFALLEKTSSSMGDGAIICLCQDWIPITKNVNAVNTGII